MLLQVVEKRAKVTQWDIIKFQLIAHCYLNEITLSDGELGCLTLLSISGEMDLTEFCNEAAIRKIFKTTQTVRNCITKMEKLGFIKKEGKSKKKIFINPELNIKSDGNLLLDIKFAYVAS